MCLRIRSYIAFAHECVSHKKLSKRLPHLVESCAQESLSNRLSQVVPALEHDEPVKAHVARSCFRKSLSFVFKPFLPKC